MIEVGATNFSASAETPQVVKDWGHQIQLAYKYRSKFSDFKDWQQYRKYYRGDWGPGVQVPINMIYANAKALIPRVYFNNPGVVVTPRRPEFGFHAQVVEAVDNNLVQETNMKYAIKRSILDAYLCGFGPLKLGFDSEYGFRPEQAVDKNNSTVSQVAADAKGDKIEFNSNIHPGMPWIARTRPEEVLVPYGYDDPALLPWICHLVLRPLKDVKADQKYTKAQTAKLQGGYVSLPDSDGKISFNRSDTPRDDNFCLLYEIRDVRKNKLITICESRIILNVDDELQIEGIPWEFINFNPDAENFYGNADVKYLIGQQMELNEIAEQERKLRRESVLKFLYLKGAISKENLELLLSTNINDIGAGVEIDAEYLQNAVMTLQPSNLTTELIRQKQEVMADMREVMGFGRNQMGEMSPKHNTTKGEAQIVNNASEIRTNERRDVVADVVTNVIRKFNQYIFKFWDAERVVQIVGPSGAPAWISYTGQDLIGEYFIKVDPENSVPISRESKFQQTTEMFGLFRDDPMINQIELRRSVLRQFSFLDPSANLLIVEQQQQGGPVEGDPLAGMSSESEPIPFGQAADLTRGGQ